MFFRKKIRSCVLQLRWFCIGLAISIAIQPVLTAAMELTKEQQQQMLSYLQQVIQRSNGQTKDGMAVAAVGMLPCVDVKKSIIGCNEQNELQIDDLVRSVDKTETSFGRVVLKQTVCPSTDMKVISKRQDQVQALLDDHELFDKVKQQLQCIKRAEHAILNYWDPSQYQHAAKLFFKSESLYYTWISRLLGDWINQNKLSLEASHASEACSIVLKLVALIGLEGVKSELLKWMFGGKKKLELWNGLRRGFSGAFNTLNPLPTNYYHCYSSDGGDSFYDSMQHGSWSDVWYASYKGFDNVSQVSLGIIGKGVKKCSGILPNYIHEKFDDQGDLKVTNESRQDDQSNWSKGFYAGTATLATPVVMAYRMKSLFDDVKATGQRVVNFTKTMKELHVHTVHVANAMSAMQKLAGIIREHSAFSTSCIAKHMQDTMDNPSSDLLKLFDVLKKDTFTLEKAKSQFYSRGNVLLAHRMFGRVKNEITPLLQAVGELDAIYSMACNIKEHKDSETPFALAEFVSEGGQAIMDLEDAWLPMIDHSVPNTMTFGGDGHPNKLVITGPNGGGKSVFLKTLGCCVVLAQSWGIVPAKRVRMSLLDGVRTCIHPQESLEHELSTFMAEKMRVDAIKQYLFQNNVPGFRVLLLLDEPFKGTVDSESADRIYEFGKDIAQLQGLIVAIATHVEKPIMLATDTGAYANYHVRIKELSGGRFEREFKLESGILDWWFRDAKKRSQFIDFVTLEKHKEYIAQQEAKAKA